MSPSARRWAGVSLPAGLPDTLDESACKEACGEHYDDATFQRLKSAAGTIEREQLEQEWSEAAAEVLREYGRGERNLSLHFDHTKRGPVGVEYDEATGKAQGEQLFRPGDRIKEPWDTGRDTGREHVSFIARGNFGDVSRVVNRLRGDREEALGGARRARPRKSASRIRACRSTRCA